MTIDFVGTAIAGGIIEHIATQYYDRLSAALGRFFKSKAKKDFPPEMSLRVSYDDVDLDIGPITDKGIADLPELARRVHEHLGRTALRGRTVTRVVIGMVKGGDRWEEPHLQEWPENARFWGISFEGHRVVTHIYDTETELLAELLSQGHKSPGG